MAPTHWYPLGTLLLLHWVRQTQLPSNKLPSLVQIYDQANCAKDLYYLKAIKNTSLSRIVSLAKHFSLLQRAGQQQFANFNQFHKRPSVPVKIYPKTEDIPDGFAL